MKPLYAALSTGSEPVDFRGPARWGHALHTFSWTILGRPRRAWWDLWARYKDHRDNVRRHSVLVHAQGIRLGVTVIWESASGPLYGRIVEVDPMGDPDDMYEITIEVRGSGVWVDGPAEHIDCRSTVLPRIAS